MSKIFTVSPEENNGYNKNIPILIFQLTVRQFFIGIWLLRIIIHGIQSCKFSNANVSSNSFYANKYSFLHKKKLKIKIRLVDWN